MIPFDLSLIHIYIVDLYNAGGVQAVMKELSRKQLIDTGLMTVTGKTVAENIATAVNMDTNIIKDIEHPNSATGGIAVLFGNIAPKAVSYTHLDVYKRQPLRRKEWYLQVFMI